MNIGLHHLLQISKKLEEREIQDNIKFRKFINKFIYVVGVFGILIIIPQVSKIWVEKNVEGVSLITWAGFLFGSIFWMLYGIVHKEKPIIYPSLAASVLQSMVIIGIIMHSR